MQTIEAASLLPGDIINLEDLGRLHVVQGPYRSGHGIRFVDLYGNSIKLRPRERVELIARDNPTGAFPWWLLLGAAAAGAGIFLLVRRAQASATSIPTVPAVPAVPRGTQSPSEKTLPTSPPQEQTTSQPRQTLTQLLTSSRPARQVFNVQATAYKAGLTTEVPDGMFGPMTQSIINSAEDALGRPHTTGFDPASLVTIRTAAMTGVRNLRLLRLPMTLPASVIRLLNTDATAVDPRAIQMEATSATA